MLVHETGCLTDGYYVACTAQGRDGMSFPQTCYWVLALHQGWRPALDATLRRTLDMDI